jgi:hypothetical protein
MNFSKVKKILFLISVRYEDGGVEKVTTALRKMVIGIRLFNIDFACELTKLHR